MIVENEYNDKDLKIQQRVVKSGEVTRKVPIRKLLKNTEPTLLKHIDENPQLKASLLKHYDQKSEFEAFLLRSGISTLFNESGRDEIAIRNATRTALEPFLLEKNLANSKLEAFLVNHHEIIGRVSQTLKILLLDCFHNNRDLPTINKGLISSIYMTVTHLFKTNQGEKRKITSEVDDKVNDLYENKMIAIYGNSENDKLSRDSFSQSWSYAQTAMMANISKNIYVHFYTRLCRYINLTVGDYEVGMNKTDAKTARNKLKKLIFNGEDSLNEIPPQYKPWYQQNRNHIAPSAVDIKKQSNINFHAKKDFNSYVKYTIYLAKHLEDNEKSVFNIIPLAEKCIPPHIQLDGSVMNEIYHIPYFSEMEQKDNGGVAGNWKTLFGTIFDVQEINKLAPKGYEFSRTMKTDGVSVSILFRDKQKQKEHYYGKNSGKAKATGVSKLGDEFPYVDELSPEFVNSLVNPELNLIERNYVGVDPGKHCLVYMSDGKDTLKYTNRQKQFESKSRANAMTLQKERKTYKTEVRVSGNENDGNGEYLSELSVAQCELTLLGKQSIYIGKFSEYLQRKKYLNETILNKFYHQRKFRNMRLKKAINERKSLDNFKNRIGTTFGKDCILFYGDWNRRTQMKYNAPSMGIGLRREIDKEYMTISIDEFRTSMLCNSCKTSMKQKTVKTVKKQPNQPNMVSRKKVYRCLLCLNCTKHFGNLRCRHRDKNSTLNIRDIGMWYLLSCWNWISYKVSREQEWNNEIWKFERTANDIRPAAFQRGAN